MGWIDDMKLRTALEVVGNGTQTLVQAQDGGRGDRPIGRMRAGNNVNLTEPALSWSLEYAKRQ